MRNISLAHFSTLGKMGQTRSYSRLLAMKVNECEMRRRVVTDVVHLTRFITVDVIPLYWISAIEHIKQVSKSPHSA